MKLKLFGRVFTFAKQEAQGAQGTRHNATSDAAFSAFLQGRGQCVTAMQALQVATVFRCVDVIAKTMASLPLHLYRETAGSKSIANDHPLYKLLHRLPNEHTTPYEFWHMYVVNLLLTRGAYAKIVRSPTTGRIVGLHNIPTASVSGVHTNALNGERYIYVFGDDGAVETLRDGEFMYTPSLRITSDTDPTDPIVIAADVLGLTGNLTQYARAAFENGANPGGYVEYPGQLSDVAYERFKNDFLKSYVGITNAGKWLFLEEGAKASRFAYDMEKSQALESRKFAVIEICRIFGVPPHLAYDLERATFSNIEHQSTEFVQNCIAPMSVRIEQTIYKDLLGERERHSIYAKFGLNGLLRGDTMARQAYYASARQNGWMNADEIRALEDLDEIPDGKGKEYIVNGNMITLSAVTEKGAGANGET